MATSLGDSLHEAAVDLETPMADLEYTVEAHGDVSASRLRDVALEIAFLRRHLVPFEVLLSRATQSDTWIVGDSRRAWLTLADRARDTTASLQALYDRLRAARADVSERLTRRTNHILYVLTLFSVVALPVNLFLGFLGMSVGIANSNLLGLDRPVHVLFVLVAIIAFAGAAYGIVKRWHLL
jgi:Mg2+ and Co2+ transporter CorA